MDDEGVASHEGGSGHSWTDDEGVGLTRGDEVRQGETDPEGSKGERDLLN